ncbi:MAG: hypothetical protein ACREVS_19360 [Burkholderiales bacterium]
MNSADGGGLRRLSRRTRLAVLWIVAGATLLLVFAHRLRTPIYSVFADQVTCLGIPNFTNVGSNLAFVLVGAWGLAWFWTERSRLLGTRFRTRTELALYASFFAAAALVGLGSGYYHWVPTNATLFWDRCPMTLAVAALTGAFIAERVDGRAGVAVAAALALFLPATLVYWRMSEAGGAENLWPYLVGLYGSLGVATLVLLLFPSPYTHGGQALVAVAWYALAMPFDKLLDGWVYSLGGVMGGHALKHLLAALAMFWLFWFMLRPRRPRAAFA